MSERQLSKWLEERGFIANLDENDEWIIEVGVDNESEKKAFSRVSEIQKLQELTIINDHFTDSDLNTVSDLPTLKSLLISGQQITGKGLTPIQKLPVLTSLHIDLFKHGGIGLGLIGEVSTLEALGLNFSYCLSDADMPALSHLSMLKDLKVMGCPIARGVEVVAQFPHLKRLSASRSLIKDESLEAISKCKKLKTLDLPIGLSDEGICKLTTLQNLEFLSFGGNITEKSVKVLSKLPNLKKVFFNGPLSPEVLLRLSELSQIVRLGVTEGDFQTPEFKTMKRKNPHVHYVTSFGPPYVEPPSFEGWLKSQGLPDQKFDDWLLKKAKLGPL